MNNRKYEAANLIIKKLNNDTYMTYKEIAERLDVSVKTVDYRIQQALKQLAVELKDYLPLLIFLLR